MKLNPRQTGIIEALKAEGPQSLEVLSERFEVSVQTLRRDVSRLADAGLLSRFHGGVRLPISTTENLAYLQREQLNAPAKLRIARAVASRIPNGSSLIMNIGTTIEAVARNLVQHQGLRVITNNLNVAAILAGNRDCEVIVAGGQLRHADRAIVGEAAVDFIRQFKVDIGLMGISGIERDGTLRDYDYREVKVAQAILRQSREVWVVADVSKFDRPAMVEVARLDQINKLFVDAPLPPPFAGLVEDSGVDCVLPDD
ncbi:MAG: DeoR/GlpR family DNA-binding transcription regulator [Rhodocyclaceae bacterium]